MTSATSPCVAQRVVNSPGAAACAAMMSALVAVLSLGVSEKPNPGRGSA
jgi:hypothetical protein